MKPRVLLLLYIFLIVQPLQSQSESGQELQKYLKDTIQNITFNENGDSWVIAGVNYNKLYHIKKLHKSFKAIEIGKHGELPDSNKYTTIQFIKKNIVLVGTSYNYVYYIKNRNAIHLTKSSGLTDSIIKSMQITDDDVIVSTPTSNYRYNGYVNRRTKCFEKLSPPREDSLRFSNFIKNNIQMPIQRAICNVASPVDMSFRHQKYITHKEIKKIKEILKPGDILIRRNDDQLSNVGIPGFWKHAAIYVGSTKEINEYFDSIPRAKGEKPSDLIKSQNNKAYQKLGSKRFQIIEVVGEGTKFSPVGHIAKSDYFAALRPNLNKEQVFKALQNALSCYGLPYDYLFEFNSPNALICSQLVYRAYESNATFKAIDFKMGEYSGHPFLSPNDIAAQFAKEYGDPQPQLQLLFFYDADEQGRVSCKSADEFSKSISR